jgi:dienelactone hydrolase
MNIKPFTAMIAAGVGLAITFTACGSSNSGHAASKKTSSVAAPATSTGSTSAGSSSLLPEPSGPFFVGVRTVPDVAPDATTRLWYPAQRGTGTGPTEYIDRASVAKLGVTMSQVAQVRPRARVDAVPAATTKARPAVVLMPGWGNPMAVSTALAQDLASNGYVVVAIDPTPGTEDGSEMPADPANPARRLDQVGAGIDFAAGRRIRALAGPVDADRIAVGGHSIAGAVAYQVAITDPRVHAVFDLDGWLHGAALTTPVMVPALMINASGLEPDTLAVIARTAQAVTVQLTGATHGDVTDLPCIAPALGSMASGLGLGTIGCTGTTTSSTLVRRFLDTVLERGANTPSATELGSGLHGVA